MVSVKLVFTRVGEPASVGFHKRVCKEQQRQWIEENVIIRL